jgi:hypothetical protein
MLRNKKRAKTKTEQFFGIKPPLLEVASGGFCSDNFSTLKMKATKILLVIAIVGGLGFTAGYTLVQHSLKQQEAEWTIEKNNLENSLAEAQSRPATIQTQTFAAPIQIVQVTNKISPEEILERLIKMKVSPDDPRSVRLLIHQFENLVDAETAALPVIRAFLARNEDMEYDARFSRGFRNGNVPTEFSVPPSLRLGLLETVKNIGGDDAETVLVETLKTTGRGIEVAYLARALQETAPDKYRDVALASARELLDSPIANPSDPLEKFDRNYLYGVFSFFNDNSATSLAQSQLVQTNGQIDQTALRYLQQTMSTQSVALAVQLYQDPRVSSDAKEPLARVALAYAGADAQADQLYQTAINDPNMSAEDRRNLIEDLNQDGLPNGKNLTQADLPLIQNRISMIEQLAPNAMDQVNANAFKEAYKDLSKMRDRLSDPPAPAQ